MRSPFSTWHWSRAYGFQAKRFASARIEYIRLVKCGGFAPRPHWREPRAWAHKRVAKAVFALEVTLGDYARANNITWQPVVFERVDTMYQAFFSGRCDAMTQDASALAGAVATAAPNPADYLVLSETISKEPLGPFTRNGDEAWSNFIAWIHYGLIEAEELSVTKANADEQAKSSQNPATQRLLGVSGEFGSRFGLDNKWMLNAIKAEGNYGEIFERNVGAGSPLKLSRGLNALWSKGGLMYAIPYR